MPTLTSLPRPPDPAMEDPAMDNPLDPRISQATLSLHPAALPPMSKTHMCFRGDPLLWKHRSVGSEGHARVAFQVEGSKGKSDQGSVTSIGDKFEGATPGEAQGGGISQSQGRDVEGCQHLAASR